MTSADSGDALARLRDAIQAKTAELNITCVYSDEGVCAACADALAGALVTAIAAPVERETRARDATTCEGSVSGNALARAIRALAPRYGGNPKGTAE